MKKTISVILALLLLSASPFCVYADDDNATGGEGNTQGAESGWGWYNTSQYLWKVTLYCGKSDTATKQDSLTDDFHKVGTCIMKKTGWTIPSGTKFGNRPKAEYYAGKSMTRKTGITVLEDAGCPAVPIACGGNLDTVKAYFGSTGTVNTILTFIARQEGTTPDCYMCDFPVTINGVTGTEWDYSMIAPNATSNRIPWVIVYEPMVIMNLKDKTTKLAFTATEFAIAQMNGWYNWKSTGTNAQNVTRLTSKHLPTSVQLEESWFGYEVFNVTDDTKAWTDENIVRGGGWGMRWMSPAAAPQPVQEKDWGCVIKSVNPVPGISGCERDVTVIWRNYKETKGTVFCEFFRENELIWSGYKVFEGIMSHQSVFTLWFEGRNPVTFTARINWEKRNEETASYDNIAVRTVTPKEDDTYDFSVTQPDISPKKLYRGETCRVSFRSTNHNTDKTFKAVPVEILVDGNVEEYMEFDYDPGQYYDHSIWISLSGGAGDQTVTVRINWDKRQSESNYGNNVASTSVYAPEYVDFSVSNLKLSETEISAGREVTFTFTTDNWDIFHEYTGIPINVYADGNEVYSGTADYTKGGRVNHSITFNAGQNAGRFTLTAGVNIPGRNTEANPDNNVASISFTVLKTDNLSVQAVEPNADYREGKEVVTSYVIINNSASDVIPDTGCSVNFRVTDSKGTEICTSSKSKAVVPKYGTNIVYFKWKVPEDSAGKTLTCTATVIPGSFADADVSDNSDSLTKTVAADIYSSVPDTKYEREKPKGFTVPDAPDTSTGAAVWTEWAYVSGQFTVKKYALSVSDTAPAIKPDTDSPSAVAEGGNLTMGSGYGVTLTWSPLLKNVSGYSKPGSSAYTSVQTAYCLIPEFGYSSEKGKFRSLENINGIFCFEKNNADSGKNRLHFTPIWYPDGEYAMSVTALDFWTPAGMSKTVRMTKTVGIEDSAYDDRVLY